jgi:hypothetical protein
MNMATKLQGEWNIDAAVKAMVRTYITKSRAGHYTVKVVSVLGACIYIQDKLPDLETAREIGRKVIRTLQPTANSVALSSPEGAPSWVN